MPTHSPFPRSLRWLLLLALSSSLFAQQPYINYRGVFNAASYHPSALPSGALAQGSLVTIFGRDFGPATPAQASTYPLADSLAGVSIEILQSGSTTPAIPLYVSPTQINALLPSTAPLGRASLRVVFNGVKSNYTPIRIVSASPGLFAINSAGYGPGVIQNVNADSSLTVNSARLTARPGQTLIVWGTGLGPVANDRVAPTAADSPATVEMLVAGKPATRLYAGRSPCCAGLDQLVFRLPDDTPSGCAIPVQVRTAGILSNTITLAVDSASNRCSDPLNPALSLLQSGGKLGLLLAHRFQTYLDIDPRAPETVTIDSLALHFRNDPSLAYSPLNGFLLPPPGACTLTAAATDLIRHNPPAADPIPARLDAGPAPKLQSTTIPARDGKTYALLVNGARAPLLFDSPAILSSPGGADVGPFSTTLTPVPPPSWTNRDSLALIPVSQPLTLTFAPSPLPTVVRLLSTDVPGNASVLLTCLAPPAATSFTVPATMLAALPVPAPRTGESDALLYLGRFSQQAPQAFSVSGLDATLASFTSWTGRSITLLPAPKP